MLNGSLPFLRSWSRDPVAVGLPFPSSAWTAKRLARVTLEAAIPGGGPVLELGAGLGVVTAALIAAGCPMEQVVVVERDRDLCRVLRARFPGLTVLDGNALDLGCVLGGARVSSIGVVLSGLPMRAVPRRVAARCYADAFRLMPSSGTIVQYTYGFRSPVDPDADGLALDARFLGREWRNVPPMGIWRYRLAVPASTVSALATPAVSRSG